MAAGSTYTPIATTTLGSAASSYTFSSISGSYTDLILEIVAGNTTGVQEAKLVFNSDTGTNYSKTYVSGNGTAASSGRRSNETGCVLDAVGGMTTAVSQYNSQTHIQNYSNTTTYKTVLCRANSTDYGTEALVYTWRSTAAITSIQAICFTGNFQTGSTFTLYGIQAA
jgi:hypothetical protein